MIFDRLGPYHVARLWSASKFFEIVGIEIVAETSEYAWSHTASVPQVKRITLFPSDMAREKSNRLLETRIQESLSDSGCCAVAIPGWSSRAALAALCWCNERSIPSVLMSESTIHDEPRVWWKELVKRRLVRLYTTALVGGRRHIEYLMRLGMARDRIFTGYDVVDNAYFEGKAEQVRVEKSEVRTKYGLSDNYFLASARFIKKKNLVGLLRAYATYRGLVGEVAWDLVLLGDGELRGKLEAERAALGLNGHVVLPGFKQYDELPLYYANASAFVHASTSEQWGLVVNEAIASGLPVIVSSRCGCVPELVHPENGFTFDPFNESNLTSRMVMLSSMPKDEREKLGRASAEIASRHGLSNFGEGLQHAVDMALQIRPKKPRTHDRILLNSLLLR